MLGCVLPFKRTPNVPRFWSEKEAKATEVPWFQQASEFSVEGNHQMVLQDDACSSQGNSLWRGPLESASIGCNQQPREVSVEGTHQQMLQWDTSLNAHGDCFNSLYSFNMNNSQMNVL